jgi:tetratricopeptide (TPR) repeat protein
MIPIYLGIDLGNHSIVTASSNAEEPLAVTVDANGLSNRSTPSIIGIENNRIIFGEEAETRLSSVPTKYIPGIPSKLHEEESSKHGPFEDILLESSHLLSLFLKNYIDQVHAAKELKFVTIAVPVGFTDGQVQKVADAAHLLGISNFDIIDHIDAAMTLVNKGDPRESQAVVVVDCGFSQTSVGLLLTNERKIASKQSIDLGVQDMTELIGDCMLIEESGFLSSIRTKDPRLFFRLFKICEKALKDLSMLPSTVVDLSDFDESLEKHLGPTHRVMKKLSKTITRDKFEECLSGSTKMKRLVSILSELKNFLGDKNSVRLELVGGGSRVPYISRTIGKLFEVEQVGRGMDGSAFAALGAALWSAGKRLWPQSSRLKESHSIESRRSSIQEAMVVQDSVQRIHGLEVLKLRRKNELEAYLYQIRFWLNDEPKAKGLLRADVIEPAADAVWKWFYAVDDGEELVAADGQEYESKLAEIKALVEKEGEEFFALLSSDKQKTEASLTANAEYLSANSAHESASDKRAKHSENHMSNEQCLKLAGKNKEEGNELFKHGTVTDAMNRYMRAINLLAKANRSSFSNEERAQAESISLSCNLNMAQCVVRLTTSSSLSQDERDGLLKRGIACADAALAVDPTNAKAKYRKAVCLDRLKETEQAKRVIDEALQQNPEDNDLKVLYDSLVASLKQQQSKAKKFFSKMFQ